MNKDEFRKLLLNRGLDLIHNRVGQHVDEWYDDQLKALSVAQYLDVAFMDDWREQRRIETYNLIGELRAELLQSLATSPSSEKTQEEPT